MSSAPALVAGALLGAAVVCSRPGRPRARRRPDDLVRLRLDPAWSPPARWWRLRLPAAAVLVGVVLVAPAVIAAAALAAGAAAALVLHRVARARDELARGLAQLVADTASALAADLGVGHDPLGALASLASELGGLPGSPARRLLAERLLLVSAAGRLGGDVPAALRAASRTPGGEALADVAAAWQVARETGAPLAGVLERVAAGIRAQQAGRRALETSLGAARASARLLLGLPVLGLLMGAGLGIPPTAFLLGPFPGRVCLVTGLGLSAAGVMWTERVARAARRAGHT